MPRISHVTKRMNASSVIGGLEKRFTNAKQTVGGHAYTKKELIAFFQAHLDALDRLDAAHVALNLAAASERAVAKRVAAFTTNLKFAVAVLHGSSPDVLADFGWKPPTKPGPKTAAAKAAGAEKVRATRKARNTMGSRQRKKVRAVSS